MIFFFQFFFYITLKTNINIRISICGSFVYKWSMTLLKYKMKVPGADFYTSYLHVPTDRSNELCFWISFAVIHLMHEVHMFTFSSAFLCDNTSDRFYYVLFNTFCFWFLRIFNCTSAENYINKSYKMNESLNIMRWSNTVWLYQIYHKALGSS